MAVAATKRSVMTLFSGASDLYSHQTRIVLAEKGVNVEITFVDEDNWPEELADLNPYNNVPTLVDRELVLYNSRIIMEYLDERFEHYPLLPVDPLERARVRSLALQIACDIHPLNNLRVQKYLKGFCGNHIDTVEWMSHWMTEGFAAIEQKLNDKSVNGSGYYGDDPGLFECFLVPQVYNAERYGTKMTAFPAIYSIVKQCRKLPAFGDAAPENQADAVPV